MRKLFKERKLFKGGNYMRKYGSLNWISQQTLRAYCPNIDRGVCQVSVLVFVSIPNMKIAYFLPYPYYYQSPCSFSPLWIALVELGGFESLPDWKPRSGIQNDTQF